MSTFDTKGISADALDVLRGATCDGFKVSLNCPNLNRSLYSEVDDALTRIGGKWIGGKVGAHRFECDPAPLLSALVATGLMPPKNPLSYFGTPEAVLAEMSGYWMVEPMFYPEDYTPRFLEPSAGRGAIADAMRQANPWADITCVELDPVNAAILQAKGFDVTAMDFLEYTAPEPIFDVVCMNPPFSVKGNQDLYIDHIRHAFSMICDGGLVLAVAPNGFTFSQGSAKQTEFRDWASARGGILPLPPGAFKLSGTSVRTVLMYLRRDNAAHACDFERAEAVPVFGGLFTEAA